MGGGILRPQSNRRTVESNGFLERTHIKKVIGKASNAFRFLRRIPEPFLRNGEGLSRLPNTGKDLQDCYISACEVGLSIFCDCLFETPLLLQERRQGCMVHHFSWHKSHGFAPERWPRRAFRSQKGRARHPCEPWSLGLSRIASRYSAIASLTPPSLSIKVWANMA